MRQLTKLYLLLSSVLICFSFSSCRIAKYNRLQCNNVGLQKPYITPVIDSNKVTKFKATVDVLSNHLSGLIIVKKTDSITTHIIFVTELGMKMFDFEAKKNEVNAIYVFEPLNKPQLINALKRNFANMLLLNVNESNSFYDCTINNKRVYAIKNQKDKWFYIGSPNNSSLSLQETFHKHKRSSKIRYVFDDKTNSYSQIICKQYGLIKFYFELNFIPKTND